MVIKCMDIVDNVGIMKTKFRGSWQVEDYRYSQLQPTS